MLLLIPFAIRQATFLGPTIQNSVKAPDVSFYQYDHTNAGKVCSPALADLEILLVCVFVITWRSYKQGDRKEGLHCTQKQTALDAST